MSAISGFCEKCNSFKKRHCNGDRNTCMTILFDRIDVLQNENDILSKCHDTSKKAIETLQQENKKLNAALDKAVAFSYHKILPAKPGDIIYRPEALQVCWVIIKVEIYEDEIVFIDDSDNIFRPDDIGKTVFLTREEAEKAIGGKEDV